MATPAQGRISRLAAIQAAGMRRREFVGLIGGAAAWPLATRTQQLPMPVIGLFGGGSAEGYQNMIAGFHRDLNEAGYIESRNVAIAGPRVNPKKDFRSR